MVKLKKIKASSLLEILIASVLIMVIFGIAITIINNLFISNFKRDDFALKNRIREIQYFIKNEKLNPPFYEENNYWEIQSIHVEEKLGLQVLNKKNNMDYIVFFDD